MLFVCAHYNLKILSIRVVREWQNLSDLFYSKQCTTHTLFSYVYIKINPKEGF